MTRFSAVGGGQFQDPGAAFAAGGERREPVSFDVGGFEGVVGVGGAPVDAADLHDLPRMKLVAHVGCHTGEVPAPPLTQPTGNSRRDTGGGVLRYTTPVARRETVSPACVLITVLPGATGLAVAGSRTSAPLVVCTRWDKPTFGDAVKTRDTPANATAVKKNAREGM
jgi:hypothetical protein